MLESDDKKQQEQSPDELKPVREEQGLNEPQPAQEEQGSSGGPKSLHFHKSMSSIFGKVPFFKSKFLTRQTAGNDKKLTLAGRLINADLIFRVLFAISITLVFLFFIKSQQETNIRLAMEGKLNQVSAESAALKASVENLREKAKTADEFKSEFVNKRQQLENELDEKEKKIEELTSRLPKHAARVKQTSKIIPTRSLKSPAIEPNEAAPAEASDAVEGKILVVKPASNMAVVNLGKKDGIKIGSIFYIYDLVNNYIGNLVIDEAEDTLSIGKITPENISRKVRENYIVKVRQNL